MEFPPALTLHGKVLANDDEPCIASPTNRFGECGDNRPDSPFSSASTHLSSATDSGEVLRQSVDTQSGMDVSVEPRPHTTGYEPYRVIQSRHLRSQKASNSQGSSLQGSRAGSRVASREGSVAGSSRQGSRTGSRVGRTLPAASDYNATDTVLAHHRRASSATIGRGPGHEHYSFELTSPGPALYNPNDTLQEHHRRFPSATFGKAPSHGSRPNSSSSPGPACYKADDTLLAGHRTFPASSFGRGPGHSGPVTRDSSPAPGSHNSTYGSVDSRRNSKQPPGASLVAGREYPTAEERLRFRRADQNTDGKLDFAEIDSLLHARFPDIKSAEVRTIFKNADRDHDGNLDFQEIMEYTHSTDPAKRKLREKLLMALAAPKSSSSFREGQERMCFRKADNNLDGNMDFKELENLMRRTFPDVKTRDVREAFQAMDSNHDGKLDFHEFCAYTRRVDAKDPSNRRLREKVHTAFVAPFTPSSGFGPSHSESAGALLSQPSSPASSNSGVSSRHSALGLRRSNSATAVGNLIANRRNSA